MVVNPGMARAQTRRLAAIRGRHNVNGEPAVNEQVRRLLASRNITAKRRSPIHLIIPESEDLLKQIEAAGKHWSVPQYFLASGAAGIVAFILTLIAGLPPLAALLFGIFGGLGLPRLALGWLVKRRLADFVVRFPDAIELLVRGLRAGLPISETMGAVASEIEGPVGSEFQAVSDRMKIGRTLEAALQETADRLGTAEFQFFVITLAIQRETGGNLAETLSNLSEVLRKRISAMSSESKASAYIIGALPFLVFGIISVVSPKYMAGFFQDQRLMIAGIVGMIWMAIGAFIMRQMINFEI
jgi:tight adherence protein B